MNPYRICLMLIIFLSGNVWETAAQDNFAEAVQTHVDHIEEFIDRFNFEEDSRFFRFTRDQYPDYNIGREIVVESLFNKRIESLNEEMKRQFVAEVTDTSRPVFLEIYDALWYATVPVKLTTPTSVIDLVVTLEIQLNRDYSIEWTIIGMGSDVFEQIEVPKDLYISASSHATYFPELNEGLRNPVLFESIISDSQKQSNMLKYKKMIEGNEISDVKILNGIQYHFLQISGWIMVVEYAAQDYSMNTGWLISEVIPVNSFIEKREYQWEKLGIFSAE